MQWDQADKIETDRLLLIPMTFEFVSKLLQDDVAAYTEFNVKPNQEWPNEDTREILPILKEKLSVQPFPHGFGAWLFIDKWNHTIIGDGGFKDPPNKDGEINLGYGIIESKRRQGYAYEAVAALIRWGLSERTVREITAECLRSNYVSHHLLRKLGMVEVNQDDQYIYFRLNSLSNSRSDHAE